MQFYLDGYKPGDPFVADAHQSVGQRVEGLPDRQRAVAAVDDHGVDVSEGGQLCRQDQPGRPGADDQDVGLGG